MLLKIQKVKQREMPMVMKPKFCKGIVIAHGKSELLLAEHIKSNLHLPIEIYAQSNGKTSIQIDSLMTVLGNNIFKNKKVFSQKYIVEEEKGVLKNFSLMPIMDLDDTSEDRKQKYISKEMFKKHWLNSYIIPIWNNSNLDEVLLDLKLINKLPNNKEKGRVYRGLFPTNKGESDKQQVENLMKMFEKSNKTNMEVFIKKCLDSI